MTANATWSVAPAPLSSQGNARWGETGTEKKGGLLGAAGLLGLGKNNGGATGTGRKENMFLKRLDATSLLGKPSAGNGNGNGNGASPPKGLGKKKMMTAASTSALSHMTFASDSDPLGSQPTTKLREETLRSLGISAPSRKTHLPLRSALKKEGGGMNRALTMASIREVEVYLPNYKTIKRNTSINFKENVRVKKIPSSSSLVNDKQELWYQDHEFKTIREKAKSMASMAEINGASAEVFVNKTGDSVRGLERYLDSKGRTKNRQNKLHVWDAVLDEQEAQNNCGEDYDDERIAAACRSYSMNSLMEAQRRAQQDALMARRTEA